VEISQPRFQADVQIGKGLRFIDHHGVVTIAGGQLTLRKRSGEIIVQAPVSEVRAARFRGSVGTAARIWIGQERYSIEPLRKARHFSSVAGALINAPKLVEQFQDGRDLTRAFLTVVKAEGGQVPEGTQLDDQTGAAEPEDQTAEDQTAHVTGKTCMRCGHVIEASQPARLRGPGRGEWAHDTCPADTD
jgi:hypothetical protein